MENPENPGGLVTKCAGPGSPIPAVGPTLHNWENPKQQQEQFNPRLYEISSLVDPTKPKIGSFLGNFSNEEMVIATVGVAPAESSCLRPWATVFMQENRCMVKTGWESADKDYQYVAVAALSETLSWTHPREVEAQSLAPRTVIYPMEAAEFMELVKIGRQYMLPPYYERGGQSMAETCTVRAAQADLKLFNYEEALQVNPEAGKWLQLSQTAALGCKCIIIMLSALGSRRYVLEDGRELPKAFGPDADEGGEVLVGICADGCTSLRDARIMMSTRRSGRARGQVSGSGAESGAAGIVSKPRRTPSTSLLYFGKS
jgi:hypothetical protein